MEKIICRRVFISGRVQGVGFRASTVSAANRYSGVSGFVQNLPDGRVEALFLGDEASVMSLLEWCKKGPSLSRVSGCQVLEEDATLIVDFEKLSRSFELR